MAAAILIADWVPTLSLVFGGCCSNAITLEQLTAAHPGAGSLITFFQFVFVALYGLPRHVALTPYPHFTPRRVPLAPYLVQVALFYAVSLLNNAAFAYSIPMAVHIIFRSGGLIVSMVLGWAIGGKRYTRTQVISVLVVTIGVLLTTLSASPNTSKASTSKHGSANSYMTGIAVLSLALLLSGLLGLTQDWTYSRYGRPSTPAKGGAAPPPAWQESMFYLHFLALPMFVGVRHDLGAQIHALGQGPQAVLALGKWSIQVPMATAPLLLNTATQLLCVAGVHRLTTRVSALTVTLVLVVRKAVSLVLSVAMMGGGTADGRLLWTGGGFVLAGTVGYSLGTRKVKRE